MRGHHGAERHKHITAITSTKEAFLPDDDNIVWVPVCKTHEISSGRSTRATRHRAFDMSVRRETNPVGSRFLRNHIQQFAAFLRVLITVVLRHEVMGKIPLLHRFIILRAGHQKALASSVRLPFS
jgi:hypothetical protein